MPKEIVIFVNGNIFIAAVIGSVNDSDIALTSALDDMLTKKQDGIYMVKNPDGTPYLKLRLSRIDGWYFRDQKPNDNPLLVVNKMAEAVLSEMNKPILGEEWRG